MTDTRYHDAAALIEEMEPGTVPFRELNEAAAGRSRTVGGNVRHAAALCARPLWTATRNPAEFGNRDRGCRHGSACAVGSESARHEHAAAGGTRRGVARADHTEVVPEDHPHGIRTGGRAPHLLHSGLRDATGRDSASAPGEDPGDGRIAVTDSPSPATLLPVPFATTRRSRRDRLPARPSNVGGIHPGMHPGTESGGGLEPLRHGTLLDGRDPRRLDLLASLRDPLRRLLVRRYRQRASIRVCVLADLSASLGFRGRGDRIAILAGLVSALGYSAGRAGDAFAFFGCDTHLRDEFVLPPTTDHRRLDRASRRAWTTFTPRGRGIGGSAGSVADDRRAGGRWCSWSRTSIFTLDLLDELLSGLARHQVVPVVLGDSGESEPARPGSGSYGWLDAESGEERTLVMRPALRRRLRDRGRAAAPGALTVPCGARRGSDRALGPLRSRSRQRLLQPIAWPESHRTGGRIEPCLRRRGPGFPGGRASRPPGPRARK